MHDILVPISGMPVQATVAIAGFLSLLPLRRDLKSGSLEESRPWKWPVFLAGIVMLVLGAGLSLFNPSDSGKVGMEAASGLPLGANEPTHLASGKGFDCDRYSRKDRAGRTPQRDLICIFETARNADREMSSHFKAYRKGSPDTEYRAITDAHLGWMKQRDAACGATWEDLEYDSRRNELAACLESRTRQRTEELKSALALLASKTETASTIGR